MSYILEALKKSDLERRQGRVPDLNAPTTVVMLPEPTPRHLLALVAVALVAVGVVLGWWRPWQPSRDALQLTESAPAARPAQPASEPLLALPRRAPETGAETAAAAALSPAGGAGEAQPAAEAAQAGEGAAGDRAPQRRVAPVPIETAAAVASEPQVRPAARPAVPPRAAVPVQAAGGSRPDEPNRKAATAAAAPVAPVRPASEPQRAPAAVPERPAAAPAPARPAPASRAAAEPPQEAPAPDRVLQMSELPAAVQKNLPRLQVTGQAFTEDAESRFVVINDRILREGESVAEDVRLERIGADGVVLNYKGYRFKP
jgi:general secretion pathway protein B